jgi:hypothetical protein
MQGLSIRTDPLSLKFPIYIAVGAFCGIPEPLPPPFGIFRPVAIVPDYFPVFKSENVGSDTIEEPAIMAYHKADPGKGIQRFFQAAESVHVKIIGRLIKEEYIGPLFKHHSQVKPVPLPAGKDADLFLLVAA